MDFFKTEQEKFWQGDFGKEYIERNMSTNLIGANTSFFSKIISRTGSLSSVLELGCNIGMNLKAIRKLLPECALTGVEINPDAASILNEWNDAKVIVDSILEVELF